ncbi:hypothetical protein WI36_21925 [Burkholderia ubonensis]|nr:hypothetical protein WI31_01680 [Burkholderia ubonensis]KUZ24560.1 hypothetical protein WI32_34640 [Burkholderia ubonensis]KUZ24617.1 hypothetical protein WI29_09420 [Burkholderia ubonensis]KUZ25834.1 hypothetical protein WI30_26215 [Burkholderia ubonensis]KUZ54227.1 hypothetical protein WI34_24255 [Burkholderia ubonensis]
MASRERIGIGPAPNLQHWIARVFNADRQACGIESDALLGRLVRRHTGQCDFSEINARSSIT